MAIDITPLDVRKKKGDFAKGMRGYAPAEVDAFLDLVAERMEEMTKELISLRERTGLLQSQADSQTARERAVQEALVSAQSLRDDIREQARREADLFRREAEAHAQRALADAERGVLERRAVLEDLERKRARFLKSFRLLLERELDTVVVEEGRPSLDDAPVELDLGAHDGRPRADAARAAAPQTPAGPMPGASGAGAPAVGDLWLSGLAGEPPPR
jgi:DivIVA domain-containing protein